MADANFWRQSPRKIGSHEVAAIGRRERDGFLRRRSKHRVAVELGEGVKRRKVYDKSGEFGRLRGGRSPSLPRPRDT